MSIEWQNGVNETLFSETFVAMKKFIFNLQLQLLALLWRRWEKRRLAYGVYELPKEN